MPNPFRAKRDVQSQITNLMTMKMPLEGGLTLDFEPVKCIADIELNGLRGQGHLIKLKAQA